MFSLPQHEDLYDQMLPFVFDLPNDCLIYVDHVNHLSELEEFLKDSVLVGIDTERRPDSPKQAHPFPTSLLQIAARRSNGEENVFLVDIQVLMKDETFTKLSEILHLLLINDNCIKIGQGLVRDLVELMNSFPSLSFPDPARALLDTERLYRKLEPTATHMISLKNLVKNYLHYNLSKSEQLSDWSLRPLTPSQRNYAANDALVLLRLYDVMIWEIQDKIILQEIEGDFKIEELFNSINLMTLVNEETPCVVSPNKRRKRELSPFTVISTSESVASTDSLSSKKRIKVAL